MTARREYRSGRADTRSTACASAPGAPPRPPLVVGSAFVQVTAPAPASWGSPLRTADHPATPWWSVGAFLLEDLLHWALARKPRGRRAVVIVDEFSKLSDRPGAAVDLVERARASGVGLVLIGQTWASLGPDETIRNRLAGTVGTVILHQLKQPEEAAALAGTKWVMERTEQTHVLDHTGLGSQRAGNRYVVHPDQVRSLRRGEAFAICGGEALRLTVRPAHEGR